MKKEVRDGFQSAELEDMVASAKASGEGYAAAVLRSELLSVGLYTLPAGGVDDQTPHGEDEVYYTVRGRSKFRCGGEDHEVRPGTVLFVPARAEHRFRHNIDALNARRSAEGRLTTTAHVGLHIGEVFYGNIGSDDRVKYGRVTDVFAGTLTFVMRLTL